MTVVRLLSDFFNASLSRSFSVPVAPPFAPGTVSVRSFEPPAVVSKSKPAGAPASAIDALLLPSPSASGLAYRTPSTVAEASFQVITSRFWLSLSPAFSPELLQR